MSNWTYLPAKAYNGVCDVEQNFRTYARLLLNKVSSLFVWQGLPETVDQRFLEFELLLRGKICWTKFEGKLYALNGSVGGEPDAYYQPCYWIVANPVLGSKQVRIRNKDGSSNIETLDGILMANSDLDYEADTLEGGISGLIYQTAGLLADNISSLNVAQINGRLSVLFTAPDEALARTGEATLKDIYSGKPYKILTEDILDKFTITPLAGAGVNNTLMSLIEAHQYILAQFFQEIGISANYNMKRERLNTAEVEMNNGALDINIWNMLKNRQEAAALINEKFGTEISVDLNFAVFNEDNGNAQAEEEGLEPDEPMEVAQSDNEAQPDGVKEDDTSEPETKDDVQEAAEMAEEASQKEDEDEDDGGDS